MTAAAAETLCECGGASVRDMYEGNGWVYKGGLCSIEESNYLLSLTLIALFLHTTVYKRVFTKAFPREYTVIEYSPPHNNSSYNLQEEEKG